MLSTNTWSHIGQLTTNVLGHELKMKHTRQADDVIPVVRLTSRKVLNTSRHPSRRTGRSHGGDHRHIRVSFASVERLAALQAAFGRDVSLFKKGGPSAELDWILYKDAGFELDTTDGC